MIPEKTIEELILKHSTLEKDLSSGDLDKKLFAEKSKEYSDVNEIIENAKNYDSDIFALRKVMKLNKRLGNTYAVLRDEVLIKTYKILNLQTKMIQKLLKALSTKSFEEYQEYSSTVFAQNQIELAKIDNVDYNPNLVETSPKLNLLMQKAMQNFASDDELAEFKEIWQERVRKILIDNFDNSELIVVSKNI